MAVGGTVSILMVPPIENIEVWIDAPMVAKVGEPFEIELHVRNKSDNEQTLLNVDIWREYLEGIKKNRRFGSCIFRTGARPRRCALLL